MKRVQDLNLIIEAQSHVLEGLSFQSINNWSLTAADRWWRWDWNLQRHRLSSSLLLDLVLWQTWGARPRPVIRVARQAVPPFTYTRCSSTGAGGLTRCGCTALQVVRPSLDAAVLPEQQPYCVATPSTAAAVTETLVSGGPRQCRPSCTPSVGAAGAVLRRQAPGAQWQVLFVSHQHNRQHVSQATWASWGVEARWTTFLCHSSPAAPHLSASHLTRQAAVSKVTQLHVCSQMWRHLSTRCPQNFNCPWNFTGRWQALIALSKGGCRQRRRQNTSS